MTPLQLRKLIPIDVVNMLLHRTTVAKDLSTLYRMAQRSIKSMLKVSLRPCLQWLIGF
jgi:hypothetical protein